MTNRRTHEAFQHSVLKFMETGGQTVDQFNPRQACLYTGLQLEELAEKVEAIRGGTITPAQNEHLAVLQSTLEVFAKEFKAGMHEGDMLRSNHADLIDADFDLAWVSIGALMSTARFSLDAIAHGTYTNLDKFRNGCIKDGNGKIQKPADWEAPDFSICADDRVRD